MGIAIGRRDDKVGHLGAIEQGGEIGRGPGIELVRVQILRVLGEHQCGRVSGRLDRSLGRVAAALVDGGADEADDRDERVRKGQDNVAAPVRYGTPASACARC